MDQLSAMDPNAFRDTGVAKMNLPIVGVVNCEAVESIRTYKGQTWLNNWAFTPLAQGQFAGNAQPARGGAKIGTVPGLGLSGSTFRPGSRLGEGRGSFSGEDGAARRRGGGRPGWRRQTKQEEEEQSEEEQYDEEQYYEDEDYEEEDYEDEDYEEEDYEDEDDSAGEDDENVDEDEDEDGDPDDEEDDEEGRSS
jgi:hypothetical protein